MREPDNLIGWTRILFVKTAVFHLRHFRKDFGEFHCAFLGYVLLPLICCDRSHGSFKHVSIYVYK